MTTQSYNHNCDQPFCVSSNFTGQVASNYQHTNNSFANLCLHLPLSSNDGQTSVFFKGEWNERVIFKFVYRIEIKIILKNI
jgi:hypothetical protein